MKLCQRFRPVAIIYAIFGISYVVAQGTSVDGEAFASSEAGLAPLSDLKDTFIVLFDSAKDAKSAFSRRTQDPHATFYEHLLKRKHGGVKHKILYSWTDSEVVSGVSIKLTNAADVGDLRNAPGVVSVHPVQRYRAPIFEPQRVSSGAVKAACKEDTFAPHVMTQVDRLHKEGYYGKGIKVAVLDTGIDYTNSALNGGLPAGQRCYGQPQCPVVGGYDLVGDAYSAGKSDPIPDSDLFADCSLHGTHVSGILVANDTTLGFTGVVPQAKIAMYRVFGCGASAVSSDVIIAGMARAVAEGADLLSISIGSPTGWANSPAALVASRISTLGVPVIVSAGNVGAEGAFLASNTASSEFSLSAASVQSSALLGFASKVTGIPDVTEIFTFSVKGFTIPANQSTTLPLYATGKPAIAEDACSPLPSDVKLDGKVVLVLRGSCSTKLKQQNVFDRGGRYLILIAIKGPSSIAYIDPLNEQQQSVSITYDEGVKLQAAFAAGKDIKVTFDPNAPFESRPNKIDGGLLTSFTNFGPTNEMVLTPNIAAPGGNILSTYPVKLGSYGIISGTSMAAPFIAGVVAQYLAIHGKTSTETIRARLMSHSKLIPDTNDGSSPLASVGRAGSGLVQAYDAIFATASAHPGQLALNDSVYFQSEHWITIKNIGKKAEKFTTTHLPAGTAQTVNTTITNYTSFNAFPVPLTRNHASVVVLPSSFMLSPGASKKVKVTVKPPKSDQRALPLYSGYIKFTGSTARSTLTVPYLGLAASISKIPVLAPAQRYYGNLTFPALKNNTGYPFAEEPTLDLSNNATAPRLSIRLSFGTPLLETSLVPGDFVFDATYKENGFATRSTAPHGERLIRRRTHQPRHLQQHHDLIARAAASTSRTSNYTAVSSTASHKPALFSDVVPIGIVSRRTFQSRNIEDPTSSASLIRIYVENELIQPDGSTFNVTEGRYRVLVRAQHPFTDATLAASYDSWLSQPFVYRKGGNDTKA